MSPRRIIIILASIKQVVNPMSIDVFIFHFLLQTIPGLESEFRVTTYIAIMAIRFYRSLFRYKLEYFSKYQLPSFVSNFAHFLNHFRFTFFHRQQYLSIPIASKQNFHLVVIVVHHP